MGARDCMRTHRMASSCMSLRRSSRRERTSRSCRSTLSLSLCMRSSSSAEAAATLAASTPPEPRRGAAAAGGAPLSAVVVYEEGRGEQPSAPRPSSHTHSTARSQQGAQEGVGDRRFPPKPGHTHLGQRKMARGAGRPPLTRAAAAALPFPAPFSVSVPAPRRQTRHRRWVRVRGQRVMRAGAGWPVRAAPRAA